jgi:predicted RNA-binding Zn-ribbon protein involved in translation (DUF1610 family)
LYCWHQLLILANKRKCMKCSKCSTEMTALDSFRCPNCGKMTCLSHRMPDRHDCGKDTELQGIEVKSLFGQSKEKPAVERAASAANPAAPPSEPRKFERVQTVPEKKKRFGLF